MKYKIDEEDAKYVIKSLFHNLEMLKSAKGNSERTSYYNGQINAFYDILYHVFGLTDDEIQDLKLEIETEA
jgi:hypothetical protein